MLDVVPLVQHANNSQWTDVPSHGCCTYLGYLLLIWGVFFFEADFCWVESFGKVVIPVGCDSN